MKISNFLQLVLIAAVLASGSTACRKNPKGTTPIYGKVAPPPGGNSNPSGPENTSGRLPGTGDGGVSSIPSIPTNPDGSTPLGAHRLNLDDFNQDRETFKQDIVYFDFDKYNVKSSELSKAQNVASYLKGQASYAVLVEGHCDERGTPEYNRALGERRALSVRESLISLGLSAERIHTISYGEDRPAETGHNESSYSKNRRGEFVLLKPKSGSAEPR